MKIDAETWSKLTKSQKRTARKKLAAEKLSLAIKASNRRDADFIARHTGSFSRKIGDTTMLKLTSEERAAISAKDSLKRAVTQNHAWNAAQILTATLESSIFEPSVAARRDSARAVKNVLENGGTRGEIVNAESSDIKALQFCEDHFSEVKDVFTASEKFNELNALLLSAKNGLDTAQLKSDESVKSGKAVGSFQKALEKARTEFEKAQANIESFLNTQISKL